MGELIDFAERQKSRRKKKASSIPPIFRKFRVHAIRLLASIIKSGSYSVAYIVKKITGKLIEFYTILTIFAKLLCAWRASSPAIAAEASVTVLKLLSSISLKRTSTAFYPTTRRMPGRLFLMNARIMAKVEVTSR